LGLWEKENNPNFKPFRLEGIRILKNKIKLIKYVRNNKKYLINNNFFFMFYLINLLIFKSYFMRKRNK
jgi:hypothetical protein